MANQDSSLNDSVLSAFQRSGMSLKAWSDRSGVPYASVHGFAGGTRDPHISTVAKLAKVLGLKLVAVPYRKRRSGR